MPRTTHVRVGAACGVGGGAFWQPEGSDPDRSAQPIAPQLRQEILHFHTETARRRVAATNITLSRGGGEQKQAV